MGSYHRRMLSGRGSETAQIERLLDDARASSSGVLVIRGEAGLGKSALLEHAAGRADGFTVLRGTGVEAESELAFAALHQILWPVLDRLHRLPAPQAEALRAAFALSDEPVGDRFRISLAVLGLLSEVAEERPVLCLIDDAQWLDQASADALVFASLRLEADAIAMLFAATKGRSASSPRACPSCDRPRSHRTRLAACSRRGSGRSSHSTSRSGS